MIAAAYLWALPVAAIPLVIYLLFRRRRRDVPWGAIYILRKVLETRSRAAAWIQYCVIALRTLACAVLVFLFASPEWPRKPSADFPASAPATHRVIILDTSASMQARCAGGTALDAALVQVRRIFLSATAPGRADLLDGGGTAALATFASLPVREGDLEPVLAACAERRTPADLTAALRQAERLFAASPHTRRELYLLGDFCARDLPDDTLAEAAPRLARLRGRGVTIHTLSLREPEADNFALYDCSPTEPVLLANQPARFRARIGYFGARPSGRTTLTLADARGTVLHEETVTLGPGIEEVVFPLALPPGEHRLSATLWPDALAADNALARHFTVRPRLNLVLLQNLGARTGFENPRTWLELALQTPGAADAGNGTRFATAAEAYASHAQEAARGGEQRAADEAAKPFSVSVEGKIPEQLNPDLLTETDLLIALEIDDMAPDAVAILRRHVVRGGTLLLAPGAATRLDRFNAAFAPLLPAPLRAPVHPTIDPSRYEQCLVESGEEAFLRELEDPRHGNVGAPRFYNAFAVSPDALAEDGRVLLGLSDGNPLLLERTLGRGTVFLWTAGLGGDWHSMVVHPAYPVWLIRILQRAAARRQLPRTVRPGEPLLLLTDAPQARVLGPGGIDTTVASVAAGGQRFIRFDDTLRPGTYDVRTDLASDLPGDRFDVVDDHAEADLRPLSPEAAATLAEASGGPLHADPAALAAAVGRTSPGRPLAHWLGATLLCALVLEAGLSRLLSV